MVQNFYALSVELIVEILSYLNHYDLLRCCQAAKKVHNIVSSTSALQYKIELGLTGNQDGSSSISIPERLAQLRLLQRSWENPKATFLHSIIVPSQPWSHSKWQKDVFFGRRPSSADKTRLEVFNIGAAFSNKERLQDMSFDVIFDAYAVDFDQDLIALVRGTHTDDTGRKIPPRVYLRSFKDQTRHDRARYPLFDLGLYGMMDMRVTWVLRPRVQIAGEYLLLTLFRSLPVESIVVWHWPSGKLKTLIYFTQEDGCINAMCTESGHLLLAKRPGQSSGRFGIFVYALEDERARLLATFELPRLRWDFRAWLTASFFPREHTCGALNGGLASAETPFAPASVLVQFQWDRQFTLYTPLVTFLSREVLDTGRRSFGPLYFAWDKWGPHSTRVFTEGNVIADICGYRAIFPDHILDFSPAALRQADSDSETRAMIIREPTTVAGPMFAEPVVTSLSYRRISFTLPSTPNATRNVRSQMYRTFVDVDGPKLLRVTCDDFILVPSSIEVFTLMEQDTKPLQSNNNVNHSSPNLRNLDSIAR